MTRYADPQAVQRAAQDWSDAIVHCRIYGHQWSPYTAAFRGAHAIEVHQRCQRCRSRRKQTMDSRTGRATPWQSAGYVDGYLLKDVGRVSGDGRNILRLAAIRHLTITAAPVDDDDEVTTP